MGKNSVVVLFLVTLASAIYLFVGRESSVPLRELEPGHSRTPRIQLEEFTVYQYEGHKAVSTSSGKLASFVDPNLLEMTGSIQGQRLDSPHKEFFSAESVRVIFAAKGLAGLMKSSRPLRTIIENQARFGYDENVLSTDFAEYLHEQKLLVSERPMRVKGPRVDMQGANGFQFQTDTQDLKIYGPMEGTLLGTDR